MSPRRPRSQGGKARLDYQPSSEGRIHRKGRTQVRQYRRIRPPFHDGAFPNSRTSVRKFPRSCPQRLLHYARLSRFCAMISQPCTRPQSSVTRKKKHVRLPGTRGPTDGWEYKTVTHMCRVSQHPPHGETTDQLPGWRIPRPSWEGTCTAACPARGSSHVSSKSKQVPPSGPLW